MDLYIHICAILNTFKQKKIEQLAAQILYRNNNPSNSMQALDQYYIYMLYISDSKHYRRKTSNK